MKILKIIGIAIAVLAVVLAAIGFISPKQYDVHRSVVIKAPAATVYHTVSHFQNFKNWSPWQHLDSAMTTSLEGTDGTVGAKYSWKGNDHVGEGALTFTKLEPDSYIEQELAFVKPFESRATTYMQLAAAEGGTQLTWGMKGENDFVSRIFMTVMGGMDKVIGKDYEQGLANLKMLCEAAPVSAAYTFTEVEWPQTTCLSARKVVAFDALPSFFGKNYPAQFAAISKAGGTAGNPLGVYYQYNEKEMTTDVAAAVPFTGNKPNTNEFSVLELPKKTGYVTDYYGPYNDEMKKPYMAMDAKLKEIGKQNPALVVEEYVTSKTTEPDSSKWHTKIYFFTE